MIKLCIFDMDGLLIDSERYMWNVSMDRASRKQGRIISQEFHNSLMGMNRASTAKIIQEEFGKDFDVDAFYKAVDQENMAIIESGIPMMKGAIELLDFLRSEGIKTCIGTSTPRKETNKILKANNIVDYFDDMVCGDEIEHGKPAPDTYLKCYEKFNFKKSEVLVFEDANSGAIAALEAGLRLVLVPDLAYISEDSKNRAFKVLEDLSQIIDIIKEENERTISI